ncbi:hypothetical protein [Acinetobacter thermotolerans]|uniref:hypothetical protein n=1 Tax=Acinetobacter thermotolerans TaxID=3151487 RepID=UPI00325C1B55
MPKLKVRKKKFNPNKRTPGEVRHLQELAKLRKEFDEVQEDGLMLEMEYVGHHVHNHIEQKKLDEKELFDRFPNSKILPFHIALGAYDYQDLGIALVLDQIEPCQWYVQTDIHLMDVESADTDMITVPYAQLVPEMHHSQLWLGKPDARVDLGNGLKKVGWKGLKQEFSDVIDQHKEIPEGYSIEMMQMFIRAHVKFRSFERYQEYLAVKALVERDIAEADSFLRRLWINERLNEEIINEQQTESYGLETADAD